LALSVLALAQMAENNPLEATPTIGRADSLQKSEYRSVSLAVAVARGRVTAFAGAPARAVTNLGATLEKAAATGLVGAQLETRLALGEIDVRWGDAPTACTRLQALQDEALEKGYALLARKAAALCMGPRNR
jgi:hypothetical protein